MSQSTVTSDLPTAALPTVASQFRSHIKGIQRKISNDFSERGLSGEVAKLSSDPLFTSLGLAIPEYALIRLFGRLSISIGRRLGEVFDDLPKEIAARRFQLTLDQISPVFDENEIDLCLDRSQLSEDDILHVQAVASHFSLSVDAGLGMELRYIFNPADSARLRKDEAVAKSLISRGLTPVCIVISTISPRTEAIQRLTKAGWHFLIGPDATAFLQELIGFSVYDTLTSEASTIHADVKALMENLFNSDAVTKTLAENVTATQPVDLLATLFSEE